MDRKPRPSTSISTPLNRPHFHSALLIIQDLRFHSRRYFGTGAIFGTVHKMDIVVTATAVMCSCDPRTVTLWYGRLPKNIDEIRKALADMPRSGRPTKIPAKLLEEAEALCAGRAFTTRELCDYMLSVRLSTPQTIQYTRKWENSRKKTSPVHVNKADMQEVEN